MCELISTVEFTIGEAVMSLMTIWLSLTSVVIGTSAIVTVGVDTVVGRTISVVALTKGGIVGATVVGAAGDGGFGFSVEKSTGISVSEISNTQTNTNTNSLLT